MSEPLTVVLYTAAGERPLDFTEEEVEKLAAARGVIKPESGRPRLAAILAVWVQEKLGEGKEFITIMDADGCMTVLRAGSVYGAKVLESIDPDRKRDLPRIGFQPR